MSYGAGEWIEHDEKTGSYFVYSVDTGSDWFYVERFGWCPYKGFIKQEDGISICRLVDGLSIEDNDWDEDPEGYMERLEAMEPPEEIMELIEKEKERIAIK